MTNQEIFDRNWQVFIVDKQPRAVDDDHGCSYSPTGNNTVGCAVGCCLSEEARKLFERKGGSIRRIFNDESSLYHSAFQDNQIEFLAAMQSWHDLQDLDKDDLIEIARCFNLNVPENS